MVDKLFQINSIDEEAGQTIVWHILHSIKTMYNEYNETELKSIDINGLVLLLTYELENRIEIYSVCSLNW